MRYPWANILLLILGTVELATGLMGLIWGSPDRAIALQIHRIVGFSIALVLLWKARNILPPLRRRSRWKRQPVNFTIFTVALSLLLASLLLGLTWSNVGSFYFLGFSGVSWHIYLSVALVPLVAWHVVFHRWSLRPRFWADRRVFLKYGGITVGGLIFWRLSETALSAWSLPGMNRRFTGSYHAASFSGNAFPAVSWLNDRPEPVDSESWRLSVVGLVDTPLHINFRDVSAYTKTVTATIDCTGGWYSTQEWVGMPLKELLDRAGVKEGAASVTVRSVTGYYRRFSLAEIREYILGTTVGGERLSHWHGFPLRLVAPGKRGYDWVKWVERVEVNDTSKWLQPPLPLQ